MAFCDLYCDPVYGFELGILGEDLSSVHKSKVLSSDQQLSPVYSPDSNHSLPFLSPSRVDECDNEILTCENQTEEVSNIDNDMSSEDFTSFIPIPTLFDAEPEWLLNTLSEEICRLPTNDDVSIDKVVTEISTLDSVGNVGMPLPSVPAGFDSTALLLPLQFATNQLLVGLENPPSRGKVAVATGTPSMPAVPSRNPSAVVATASFKSNVMSSYSSSSSSGGESQRKRSSNTVGAIVESGNKNKMTAKRRRTSAERRTTHGYDEYDSEVEEDFDAACEPTADKSRNAINAKLNREKKKAYIADLERKVTQLRHENGKLTADVDRVNVEKEACVREVQYLRNILINQSTLAKVLAGLPEIRGVHLRSSLFTTATSARLHGDVEQQSAASGHEHDYGGISTSSSSRAGGICLHVNDSRVSVELCSTCANMAAQ